MEIDPVVVLADELRATEAALRAAMRRYEKSRKRENGSAVDSLLESVKTLRRDIFKTVPTSALGAGELVRLVAQYLPFSFATYTTQFHEVADRLSAGQRQRVNIARAMVLDPELLILDETLSALDQVEQGKLLALFETLQRQRGITYIYISHDLGMVRRVCNRVAVMYLGRVVELSDNHTTFFNPSHPYTRALLSAVPSIEERPYSAERYLLEGEPPNPINIPPGCSFRTRCPFAIDTCASVDPQLSQRADTAFAACHLARIDEAA